MTLAISATGGPAWPSTRTVLTAAVCTSLLLSLWSSYALYIPNPDASLYLRAAERYAEGRWADGIAIYRWPFYSLCIAAVMVLSGLPALVAVQIVNAVVVAGLTVAFIALAARLAPGDRLFLVVAAFMVVFQPQLMELRAVVVRDTGYLAFLLLALYALVRDIETPGLFWKAATAAAIVLAALFRIEALFLVLLVPLFYLTERAAAGERWRWTALGCLVCLPLLFGGRYAWNQGIVEMLTSGDFDLEKLGDPAGPFKLMLDRMRQLENDILPPFGRNRGLLAYVGIVIAITLDTTLRALTWPIAILTAFAFVPQRIIPAFAARVTLWFGLWQMPLLILFVFLALYLDWRYAMGLAVILTIPAMFTVTWLARGFRAGDRAARLLFPGAVVLLAAAWISDIPSPHRAWHLKTAGEWVRDHLPPDAWILTNDARIAYFSEREFDTQIVSRMAWGPGWKDLEQATHFVLVVGAAGPPAYVTEAKPLETIGPIAQSQTQSVMVYRLR